MFKAELLNIALKGFAMLLREDVQLEAENIIEFELKAHIYPEPLIGNAKVRHVSKIERYRATTFKIGLEFMDINKDTILFLIKRYEAKIAEETRLKKNVKPLDFMPY